MRPNPAPRRRPSRAGRALRTDRRPLLLRREWLCLWTPAAYDAWVQPKAMGACPRCQGPQYRASCSAFGCGFRRVERVGPATVARALCSVCSQILELMSFIGDARKSSTPFSSPPPPPARTRRGTWCILEIKEPNCECPPRPAPPRPACASSRHCFAIVLASPSTSANLAALAQGGEVHAAVRELGHAEGEVCRRADRTHVSWLSRCPAAVAPPRALPHRMLTLCITVCAIVTLHRDSRDYTKTVSWVCRR